ncbi:MAG: 50S ribosomal protein L4 [Coxiella sp. RIFCSPHIGHO2_12_FULL_44_14]|nr:MAG: 50S ribosomal protein L4 [Coxiella sp. RIFCSPHIGHO2_12_FULL_44_14]
MELSVENQGKLAVSERVFGCPFKEGLVHQVVTAYIAAGHTGTKAQKTRAQVRGGGAKPWRQKGTGRARAGTIRSPLWRGGGVTFAAKPHYHAPKINKKMYHGALTAILSELVRQNRLTVVETMTLKEPKTRELLHRLSAFPTEKIVIVLDENDHHVFLAARNLARVTVETVGGVSLTSLIAADRMLITIAAIKKLEERLA